MKLKRYSLMIVTSRYTRRIATAPDDMLRYDLAFRHVEQSHMILFPVFQTKRGNLGGTITPGRWHSFGCLPRLIEPPSCFTFNSNEWVTFRRRPPIAPISAEEWSTQDLIPITLTQFLQAKDIAAIEEIVRNAAADRLL